MNHPELEILADMVSRPESAPAPDVITHVSECVECRKSLAYLSRLQHWIHHAAPRPEISDDMRQQIADYVDERLAPDLHQQLARQLHTDKPALKAVLHYAAGRSRYPAHEASSGRRVTTGVNGSVTPSRWLRQLLVWFRQPSPAWTGLSAAAAAVLVMAVVLRPMLITESYTGVALAPYQDAAEIEFYTGQQPPGMGFFNSARDSARRPFSGVEFEAKGDNKIAMRWPAVGGALTYHVALYEFQGAEQRLIAERRTDVPAAEMDLSGTALRPGTRYQWELRGKTDTGQEFVARGGIVPVSINN